MKKGLNVWVNALLTCSFALLLSGCVTLDYVDDDFEQTRSSSIQTSENFNISAYTKTNGLQDIKVGVSETTVENALVLYLNIKNNSDTSFLFDTKDIQVTSPIGEVSFINPALYLEAYQNFESSMLNSFAGAGGTLGSFANIQNSYTRINNAPYNLSEKKNGTPPEYAEIERVVSGVQKHSIKSTQYIAPKTQEYFYVFLRRPEEYPIIVKYKDLTYKFGSKKNSQ